MVIGMVRGNPETLGHTKGSLGQLKTTINQAIHGNGIFTYMNPRSPKTIKRMGFHQRLLVLVGNFNHSKLGTIYNLNSLGLPG